MYSSYATSPNSGSISTISIDLTSSVSRNRKFADSLRWRGVDSNFEFLDAFVRSASSSDLLERAFWR